MPVDFLDLPPDDRRRVLDVAADATQREDYLLEKDVWVVWALGSLCESSLGKSLVFKGGTSLTKAYGVINRFSEDIDLTCDIRSLIPEMLGDSAGGSDVEPPSRSQAQKLTKAVEKKLPEWIRSEVLPHIETALSRDSLTAELSVAGNCLLLEYDKVTSGPEYISQPIRLEFGARSTGEPSVARSITCDASGHVDGVDFPTAGIPRVMKPERTFWEKATAVHVICSGGKTRGERFSRHLHDLVKLDDAGVAASAIADRDLAMAVAEHKSAFFIEKDANGDPIDYARAVGGDLRLVPEGAKLAELREDYSRMVDSGLLLGEEEPFETVLDRCGKIADRANGVESSGRSDSHPTHELDSPPTRAASLQPAPDGVFAETVTEVEHYTDRLFRFRLTRPASFRFRSGEFVMLGLPGDKPVWRAYSITTPSWDETLEFYSIKVPGGPLTEHLQKIRPGDAVWFKKKPTGTLVLDALLPGRRLWMVSSGTGFAPFASIIRDPEAYEKFERLVVTHTCREEAELAYSRATVEAALSDPLVGEMARDGLSLVASTTRGQSPLMGRITALIEDGSLFEHAGLPPFDAAEDRVMICGSMAMLKDVRGLVEAAGFSEGSNSAPGQFVVEKAFAD